MKIVLVIWGIGLVLGFSLRHLAWNLHAALYHVSLLSSKRFYYAVSRGWSFFVFFICWTLLDISIKHGLWIMEDSKKKHKGLVLWYTQNGKYWEKQNKSWKRCLRSLYRDKARVGVWVPNHGERKTCTHYEKHTSD